MAAPIPFLEWRSAIDAGFGALNSLSTAHMRARKFDEKFGTDLAAQILDLSAAIRKCVDAKKYTASTTRPLGEREEISQRSNR